ncbi:MAG: translation initiation factor eIF-1A [Candidatus Micrarchaeia archaeon]
MAESEGEEFARVRVPRKGEILGVVTGMMGASRVMVACKDGKERLCRIPGKIKKNIWVKMDDVVIIRPWAVEGDKRGDIVWRYTHIQAEWLKRKGYL